MGATTSTLRGGLGSASSRLGDGLVVGAIVAVNAVGSATIGDSKHFWAAHLEHEGEFGGMGWPEPMPPKAHEPVLKPIRAAANTTIGIVATNARLSKAEAYRLAVMAQSGLARSLFPVHTPLDGDAIFAVSTGDVPLKSPLSDLTKLGAAAANTLARAVARGVYQASPAPPHWKGPPAWRTQFEGAR
jgi:L-aminopeptidase/D-esterase-like protein